MEDINILHLDKSRIAHRLLKQAVAMVANCHHAGSLAEAWQAIADKGFNFIVTDMELPDGDGLSFVQQLRQTPGYGKVPIILYTASLNNELAFLAMKAGCNDSLPKSIDRFDLQQHIVALWEVPEVKVVTRELLQLTCFAWVAEGVHHEYSPDLDHHVTGQSREECREKMQDYLEREVRAKKDPTEYPADVHVMKHIIRLDIDSRDAA